MADLREGLGAAPIEAPQFYVPDHAEAWHRPEPPVAHDEPTTHSVQGEVEGVAVLDENNSVELLGERFRLADNIGLMPLARFANASKRNLDSDDMEGLAAMYSVIRSVIYRPPLIEPDMIEIDGAWQPNPQAGKPMRDEAGKRLFDESEWDRFQEHAEDMGADGEELMQVVGAAMEVISARPQRRRAVSSPPSPTTSPNSRESSSSRVTRPDLAGVADMTPINALGH